MKHILRRSAARAGLATALLVGGVLASSHASAAQVIQNNWRLGSAAAVNVSPPTYNGQGGEYSGTLDGKSFLSFCVDLFQNFNWNTTYTYTVATADSVFTAASLSGGGGTRATDLARLYNNYYADSSTSVDKSGGLQLAIWEVISETSAAYNLASGTFVDSNNNAARGFANAYLTGLGTKSAGSVQLTVLKSGTNQDFITLTQVPLPGALGLLAVGFMLLGGAGLRRRAATA